MSAEPSGECSSSQEDAAARDLGDALIQQPAVAAKSDLAHQDSMDEVDEMDEAVDLSPRQLRRIRRRGQSRAQRRLRLRRHGRRAYIRSVYFLPSMATLGNAVCGFIAMYVATMVPRIGGGPVVDRDPVTAFLAHYGFTASVYFIVAAMVCDALDGRLARFARHTTDFGGQLDSLADVISFGAALAFVALLLLKHQAPHLPVIITRGIWTTGAIYLCCTAVRLARFNVSNEHGEQHHFSFLGLPSPGAAAAVAAVILLYQTLAHDDLHFLNHLALLVLAILPFVVLATGLLMISNIRYPHIVNRYLRGKRSIGRLMLVVALVLLLVIAHEYILFAGTMIYAFWGPVAWMCLRLRRRKSLALGKS